MVILNIDRDVGNTVGHGAFTPRQGAMSPVGLQPSQGLRSWSLLVGGLLIVYTAIYLGTAALPGDPAAPLGWWGWFDQGKYIESAKSFADGTWRSVDQFYPPAYPWLGSWFIRLWPGHPFFLIDFTGLALHVATLVVIGRRFFGSVTTWITILATFSFFPFITVLQWEIPWTTSLSSGLGAVFLLGFLRFSDREWLVRSPLDWAVIALCSLAFGSLCAVRPLDLLVWLPIGLTFYASIAWRNAGPRRPDNRLLRMIGLASLIIVIGIVTPICYVYFNYVTSGTFMGVYIIHNKNNGYQIHGLLRKSISLFFDSKTVYVESAQALASQFWPIYLAFPLVIFTIVRKSLLLRMICVTIALQYMIYIPYADLLPNGLFRYNNVHYFTWTFPWLVMLCLGFAKSFIEPKPRTRVGMALDLGVVVVSIVFGLASLRAVPVGAAVAGTPAAHEIVATLDSPQRVDMIDFNGVTGSWPDIYFGANTLQIDGMSFPMVSDFRLVPTEHGLRMILPRTILGRAFTLQLDPGITIDPSVLSARAAEVHASIQCRIRNCALPPLVGPLPLVEGPTSIAFNDTGRAGAYLADGWSDAEHWGRWSSALHANLTFRVDRPRDLAIRADVQPLLSAARPQQTVTVAANGCLVGSITFSSSEEPPRQSIVGHIPARCIGADGHVDLDVSTDRAVTPKSIGINDDVRVLGVGMVRLNID